VAKLCLGTAQFGGHDRTRYGLNAQRPPTRTECADMVRKAERAGLTFDTAAAYGVAEELLGSCLSPGVALTTKLLPFLSSHPDHLTRLVASQVLASRTRLRRNDDSAVGVMFHSAQQGADPGIVAALLATRDAGLSQHVGTSMYYPNEFDALVPGQDIVQFPYSVFDRRFEEQGVFQRARDRGITVYARAPFCQGLVVMEPERVPERLAHARPYVRMFQGICAEHGVAPAEAALRFALESPADYVVFGVDTMAQLEEDLAIAASESSPAWLALRDALVQALRQLPEAVVVPSLWAKA